MCLSRARSHRILCLPAPVIMTLESYEYPVPSLTGKECAWADETGGRDQEGKRHARSS